MNIFANGINSQLNILNLIMQKNYLLFNLLVLLFGMTFNGLVVQPSSAAVMANDYTPAVTEDEVSVFLETSYDNAKIWAWNDKVGQFTTAGWPGDAMTLMGTKDGKNVFKWTYTAGTEIPTGVIFTHDGEQKLNGGNQKYVNHGYYVEGKYTKTITPGPEGKVMVFFDNSTANLADVYCYIYDGTKAAQEWPGLKMSLDNETEYNGKKGYYTVEVPAAFVTGYFVINNGKDGSTLTGETVYVSGQASSIENTTLQEVKKTEDNAWYTLTGMRIGKPAQPGLYIHNGKKVIIRK